MRSSFPNQPLLQVKRSPGSSLFSQACAAISKAVVLNSALCFPIQLTMSCFFFIYLEFRSNEINALQINLLPSFLSAFSRYLAASSKTCTFFRKVLICSMWESLELNTSLKGQSDISKSCWSKRDASESKKNSSLFKLLSLFAILLSVCAACGVALSKQRGSYYQWTLLLSEGSPFLFSFFLSFFYECECGALANVSRWRS